MRSVLSISLIFVLLLGQAVVAAPHSHGDRIDAEPVDHATRAHVHLHRTSEATDDHCHEQEPASPSQTEGEHDSDAVYVGNVDLSTFGNSNSLPELALAWAILPNVQASASIACLIDYNRSSIPSSEFARPQCALYEQLLSIRC